MAECRRKAYWGDYVLIHNYKPCTTQLQDALQLLPSAIYLAPNDIENVYESLLVSNTWVDQYNLPDKPVYCCCNHYPSGQPNDYCWHPIAQKA